MKNFHPFKLIAVNKKSLIEECPFNHFIELNDQLIAAPREYYSYTEDVSEMNQVELSKTYRRDIDDSITNVHDILMQYDFEKNSLFYLFDECFQEHTNKKICIGDYFTNGKDYYVFGLIRTSEYVGVSGFGFINLTTKRPEKLNIFMLKYKKSKKNKLSFLGNMYIQGVEVVKDIVIKSILLNYPDKVAKYASEKRIYKHIEHVYKFAFKFDMFIIEDEKTSTHRIDNYIPNEVAVIASKNIWNINIYLCKDVLSYVIKDNNLSHCPNLRCCSGDIFYYEISDNVKERIREYNNKEYQEAIALTEEEKNVDYFEKQKKLLILLEESGNVYAQSVEYNNLYDLQDVRLFFHLNSMVYKQLKVSNVDEVYMREYLKMI